MCSQRKILTCIIKYNYSCNLLLQSITYATNQKMIGKKNSYDDVNIFIIARRFREIYLTIRSQHHHKKYKSDVKLFDLICYFWHQRTETFYLKLFFPFHFKNSKQNILVYVSELKYHFYGIISPHWFRELENERKTIRYKIDDFHCYLSKLRFHWEKIASLIINSLTARAPTHTLIKKHKRANT